jgi:hypothetical protein
MDEETKKWLKIGGVIFLIIAILILLWTYTDIFPSFKAESVGKNLVKGTAGVVVGAGKEIGSGVKNVVMDIHKSDEIQKSNAAIAKAFSEKTTKQNLNTIGNKIAPKKGRRIKNIFK